MILALAPFIESVKRREHRRSAFFQIIGEPFKIKFTLERADVLKADKRTGGIGNGPSLAKYPS